VTSPGSDGHFGPAHQVDGRPPAWRLTWNPGGATPLRRCAGRCPRINRTAGDEEVPKVNDGKYSGWHKSTYSGNANSCVEVGRAADGAVGVRDTKQHGRGPVLEFSPAEWQSFLTGIQNGELAG
jgi:hypothetical protein